MSRVLITGAAGFLGSTLVESLRETHEVTAIVRDLPAHCPRGVECIAADLARPLDESRLPSRVDAVIHLAQAREYREFPEQAHSIFNVNVSSTLNLLEYARRSGAERFVLASTGGLYGLGSAPFVESDSVSPEKFLEANPASRLNFYFTSKYAAELLVRNYAHDLRTTTLRFFFLYGAGQTGLLMSNLLARVRAGEEVTIEGDPGMRLNPIHVSDAARIFAPVLSDDVGGTFNIAGDEVVTFSQLVHVIGEVTGVPPRVRHLSTPGADLVADTSRMRDILRVKPAVSLREGLRGML